MGAGGRDEVAPLPVLAEGLGHRAVAAGELRHHQRLRHEIRPRTAPFLGHCQRAEAQLRAFLDDAPVPWLEAALDLVALERARAQFLVREFSGLRLPVALLF